MNGVDLNALVAGLLSGVVGVSALLALVTAVPLSVGVLALFRRRILRSMIPKAPSTANTAAKQDSASSAPHRATRPPIAWGTLCQAATRHRAALARVYLLGGIGFAAALAGVSAIANVGQEPFSLVRFLLTTVIFSTPLALGVRLLYGRWKPSFVIVGCQLVALFVLNSFVPLITDDAGDFAIVVSPLLALLLYPRVRAMGVLATGFFTVVFTGALVSVVASIFLMRGSIQANILADPRTATIKRAIEASGEAPSSLTALEQQQAQLQFFEITFFPFLRDHAMFAFQTIAVLVLVGLLVSVALGSFLFVLVTRSYARKRLSEQWLVIASAWFFLATVGALGSAIGLPANLACFAAFGLAVTTRWRRLPRYEGSGVRLLLLRSFSLGERSNRLFQDFESLWRSIGSVQLVGGVDLALTTLEPHELLDFLRGRSGREFVHDPAEVDARLALFDHARDPDGRFRVNVIFCAGDESWKYAVDRMLIDSDCVLMDLRGFSRHRSGCVFEIRCLAESDLPFRTVFLVDETTDRRLVSETWAVTSTGADRHSNGNAFQFVSEQPFGTTVSERIIAAFSSPDAGHDLHRR